MKLLSRFIWLVIGLSAIVFTGIIVVHVRADKEFALIKNSIKEEYSLQVDKILAIERTPQFNYNYDVCHSQAINTFLKYEEPQPQFLDVFLDSMVMNHFNVDAIWFYKGNGEPFYFFSHKKVSEFLFELYPEDLDHIFENSNYNSFYVNQGLVVFRVLGERLETEGEVSGYVFTVTEYDIEVKQQIEKEINGATVTIVSREDILPPILKKTIRIERLLMLFDGETVGRINVELKLPFLILWQDTSLIDKLLMSGSLLLILLLLIVSLSQWVISPLKRISDSLRKGNSGDIIPLLTNPTELGDVARMIGDYHKKTAELESSEGLKRHIIENAQVGIIIIDAENHSIIMANPYACMLIGSTPDVVHGNLCLNFLCPLKTLNECPIVLDEKINNQEGFLMDVTGNQIPILRTVTSMLMDGKPVYMETFVDLREIKHLQSALQEERQKLSMAVSNSGLIFCEYNFKNKSIILPPEWQFLLKGKNDIVGLNIIDNIETSDINGFEDQLELIKTGAKDTFSVEFRVKHPSREQVWVSVSILISKRDANGNPEQLIGLFEDITERIVMQQELIKAKEKAEESDRQKSAYLANMSHKIRTPMNAIVGFTNLLVEEELTLDEKENYIGIIHRDTEQLLHLIDDIINIAKIDAEQLSTHPREFHINDLMNQLSEYYRSNDKNREINFTLNTMLKDGKDAIVSDPDQLHMVLDSLLNNAFKFTTKGQIELGYYVNPVGKKLILYVKDTGIGIPENAQDKVFNRFYQVDSRSDGTGLGLTISKGIVALLGGRLYFDSKEKEGSTFYVELPMDKV